MPTAIGIDFGTSYSCVGVCQNGNVEIIANELGNHTIPSYVAFTETGRIIGDGAKNQVAVNPQNTVFDVKRLIGRNFDDAAVQSDMRRWPFKIVSAEDGRPKVQVEFKGQTKNFHPEEISSMVLTKLMETAETYLGYAVKYAVIAVPAHFNDSQRKAITDAGIVAGLDIRIINEPTAAALAYGFDKGFHNRNVLVFDLGGGTFDVSIINIRNKKFEVKSTAGDTHLCGEDFDNRLVDYFVAEFKRKHENMKDLRLTTKALRRLRTACERAKRVLSTIDVASIEIDSIFNDIDFYTSITRTRFEELCSDLFSKSLDYVEEALIAANVDKSQIDDVILVGGSTRIPKVQELLSKFFDGKVLNKSVNPDEAVAYGASVQAARLCSDTSQNIQNLLVFDVTPFSIGVKTAGGAMETFIKRNTTIPTRSSKTFGTIVDNQSCVSIKVYEGESDMVRDNNLLQKVTIHDIPPGPRDVNRIEITFEIDYTNALYVTVLDKFTGYKKSFIVSNNAGRLSQDEIKRMINDAEKYKADDEAERERVAAMNKLEDYCFKLKRKLDSKEYVVECVEVYRQKVCKRCDKVLAWLNADRTVEKEEIDYRQKVLEHSQQKLERYQRDVEEL